MNSEEDRLDQLQRRIDQQEESRVMTVVMTAVMTPTWTLDLHLCRRHQGLKEGGGGGGGGGGEGGGEDEVGGEE